MTLCFRKWRQNRGIVCTLPEGHEGYHSNKRVFWDEVDCFDPLSESV